MRPWMAQGKGFMGLRALVMVFPYSLPLEGKVPRKGG